MRKEKNDITASVVGAITGDHPYVTPYRLNAEKRGVEFPDLDRENPLLRRGRWLEPAIALAFSERRPDLKIEPARIYVRDTDIRLGATPDFFIYSDPRGIGVLQAKTVAPHIFVRDWDEGRDPPRWIVLQILTEMMLTGAAFGMIAALTVDPFAMDLHLIEVPRYPSAEERLKHLVSKFWDDIDFGREPMVDFTCDGETIATMLRRETFGKHFDATGNNHLPSLLAERALLKASIKNEEARCDEIESEIKFTLGDAEVIDNLHGWKVTFKTTDYKAYEVKARSTRVLRITDRRPAEERPQGEADAT